MKEGIQVVPSRSNVYKYQYRLETGHTGFQAGCSLLKHKCLTEVKHLEDLPYLHQGMI
jgi:hypothetical protein